jgi:molybdopterin molybdotransferase
VATLDFRQARACVIENVSAAQPRPNVEAVMLEDSAGRVLADTVAADRDSPATARSVRDGFAVRSADTPGRLRIAGEVRAGDLFTDELRTGEAVEIMTGAPVPAGADAVVMIEHVQREAGDIVVPAAAPGQFINPRGCEARAGEQLLCAGRRIGFAEVALLAGAGKSVVCVYARPRVAIIATGDEIVEIDERPAPHQVRNSNAHSLAVQARSAGALPEILPVARDNIESTRTLIERGLASDLLLLSGGVSAGKYDIVEEVLGGLGAEFFFDRVLIQPGQPLVFGRARGTFFFGLPGNPASTMVTFEVFARAAIELLGGEAEPRLPVTLARLTQDFRHRPGLTRFLPARLSPDGRELTPIEWHGSSDVPAMARANAFLITEPDRESWKAGDLIEVLVK